MNEARYDLHCHSVCSDGELTPEELIHFAKECNLAGLSITDHDTVDAYSKSLFKVAEAASIDLIVGIELSTHLGPHGVHVLGYGVDYAAKPLLAFCERQKKRRWFRNEAIVQRLQELGYEITMDELYEGKEDTVVGRPHIGEILCNKGYVRDLAEAFSKLLGDKKAAYVQGERFHPQEAIDVIHQAGGKAVLAHPHLIRNNTVLKQVLELPFDGMECYYCMFNREQNQKMCDIANQRGLFCTGGSDFHGTSKPYPKRLGCSYVLKDQLEAMLT